ncbi:Non-specific lipid-transfer protein-like protein [Zea mays]|uniref:Non-specific lipid-transfer protein-like protein n=1 Tax=Zea mays TaxID=4577 RepID=A0A3L6DW34_MAIZE|nr:Non-specific lipid-transfer protein-like protein [Zea mays]
MGSASASVTTTSLLALALAALAFVSRAAAQGNGCSSVMMTLAPCMDFISSKASEPGISCCSVLAGVVQTDPRCLCMVLDGTATSFGIAINQTRALELPGVCKVKAPPISQCTGMSCVRSSFKCKPLPVSVAA